MPHQKPVRLRYWGRSTSDVLTEAHVHAGAADTRKSTPNNEGGNVWSATTEDRCAHEQRGGTQEQLLGGEETKCLGPDERACGRGEGKGDAEPGDEIDVAKRADNGWLDGGYDGGVERVEQEGR
jgi:hypothetical protein